MRTAALISSHGSIDWLCLPRFDSPSVFARLLDHRVGGFWSIRPVGEYRAEHWYEPDTNLLVTHFETPTGVLEMTDFMPALEWDRQLASHHEIHRRLDVRSGRVDVEVHLQPRFAYGLQRPRLIRRRHGVLATDGKDEAFTISCEPPLPWEVDAAQAEARSSLTLDAGGVRWLVLRYDDDEVLPHDRYESDTKLENTRRFWKDWVADIRYAGTYRDAVVRSALVLKLLFYAPTGAVVAAPTTSLPEEIGGIRNFDYRYSWLRDSTYTLFGLHALGKFEELDRYMVFLKKLCRRESAPLPIIFGIRGDSDFTERELDHLEGYRQSRPVRVGNAAVSQFQLDVYGEVLDSVHIWRRRREMTEGMWELAVRLVNEVLTYWRRPDQGVWEFRTEPRHFVFSKVMCWVALDRAIRAAEDLGLPADLDRWRQNRDEIHRQVLENGWSDRLGAFVQSYESEQMDAANLLIGILRFLPHQDPRVRSTIERIAADLCDPASGLIYRYRTDDGFPGREGAFCVNTFHLAQALVCLGERERAIETFERVLSYASPLGLLSEEIDPRSGELVGNFPQAFSHIGVINAAHVLARIREPRQADDVALLPG